MNNFQEQKKMGSYDYGSQKVDLIDEVLRGFSHLQKTTSAKLLYDEKGSEIFEEICKLKEYYPTRTEKEILEKHASEISSFIGERALIIEPGSGAGEKIRYLLPHLMSPKGYIPIEISREILLRMTDELGVEFPNLMVTPVCADFTTDFKLPFSAENYGGKKVIFFPGSTIGNFSPHEAIELLKHFGEKIHTDDGLLVGGDLKKDGHLLKLAYDDPKGVTARFNLNLLTRLNREANATFDRANFEHKAFYNEKLGRVEMHLLSKVAQIVRINQVAFSFREGETIHTENSYKYSIEEFCELGAKAGLRIVKHWEDQKKLFCVYYFEKG